MVNMAVPVYVNVRIEPSQLEIQLRRAQDGIQKLLCSRNESRHQIDAWQKVRVGDDFVASLADLFVVKRRKVRHDVFFRESDRPSARMVVPPYGPQLFARL